MRTFGLSDFWYILYAAQWTVLLSITAFAGGGTFASGALQGNACACGPRPGTRLTGRINPTAAVAASDTETKRGIADMSHLSNGRTPH